MIKSRSVSEPFQTVSEINRYGVDGSISLLHTTWLKPCANEMDEAINHSDKQKNALLDTDLSATYSLESVV
jgi:hypothetical protein